MTDYDEMRRQQRERLEKIPAATIDADSVEAQNAPPVNMTQSQSGGDEMGKMTVEEVDELRSRNRMKVRQPQQRALSIVPQATVTAPVVSETAPAAPTLILGDAPCATYRAPVATAPTVTLGRLQHLWRWLFVAPIASTSTDLIQLRRDIKEWTLLQHKIDRLKHAQRNFHIRSEIARYIFLALTAAFYVLFACAALHI